MEQKTKNCIKNDKTIYSFYGVYGTARGHNSWQITTCDNDADAIQKAKDLAELYRKTEKSDVIEIYVRYVVADSAGEIFDKNRDIPIFMEKIN